MADGGENSEHRFAKAGRYFRQAVLLCVVVAQGLLAYYHIEPPWRTDWFDLVHRTLPRTGLDAPGASPVRIVAIQADQDEQSDINIWPRDRIARVIDRIGEAGATVIGLDYMLDNLGIFEILDAKSGIVTGPDNTHFLAEIIEKYPVVTPVILSRPVDATLESRSAKRGVSLDAGLGANSPHAAAAATMALLPELRPQEVRVRPHPAIERAATSHGLAMDVQGGENTVRRIPAVGVYLGRDGTVARYFSLAVELLRIGLGQRQAEFETNLVGDVFIRVGPDIRFPVETDGAQRLHLRAFDESIYIDGNDVFRGRFEPGYFQDKYVIITPALGDFSGYVNTPTFRQGLTGGLIAQAIEQVLTAQHMWRPQWLLWGEVLFTAVFGMLIVVYSTRFSPRITTVVTLVLVLMIPPLCLAMFHWADLLPDGLGLANGLFVIGSAAFGTSLIERDREYQQTRMALLEERAEKARLDGELDVARQIQMGLLPEETLRPGTGIEIACHIEPARSVGGDFYDHIVRRDGRIFVLIADVSGKGVPASLFMALSKSLWKSAALRRDRLGEILALANREITRDNTDQMFVTGVACLYDPATSKLIYGAAGHDMPLIARTGESARTLPEAAGPPMGLVDDLDYSVGEITLSPGDTICLFTDGFSEAEKSDGFYGINGLCRALNQAVEKELDAAATVGALLEDLDRETAGSEQTDDRTVVIIRASEPLGQRELG